MLLPLFALFLIATQPIEADFVLKGGLIIDGTGEMAVLGDIAVKNDRIVAIGSFSVLPGTKTFDASKLTIAPGFIDLHTHSDFPLLKAPTNANLNFLFQGVTTAVTGNCGSGPVDTEAFYKGLLKVKVGSNVAHQIPHNDIRKAAMGNVNRAPTEVELKKMTDLTTKAMRDGAWGLSTGLIYNPGTYAKTSELITLAKIASSHGGFYSSHIRDEGSDVLPAINEALIIGKAANIPVHISHIKVSGRSSWGRSPDVLAQLMQARKNGIKVTADQYPYIASSTSLTATVVPSRFREGDRAELVKRFDDPELGMLLRKAIAESLESKNGGADLRVAFYAPKPAYAGKNIVELAKITGKSALELVIEIEKNGGAQIVHFGMSEEDMRLFMKQDFVATASDGGAMVPDTASVPHPRNYGTFPRKIGFYSIQEKLIPLETAIRSASGLPADILGLKDRGYLKVGYFADIVVFNQATFRDKATYNKPHQYAAGVSHVLVNGSFAIMDGKPTGKLAGRPLKKTDQPK